jgi:Rrf2 family protein
MIRVSKKQDYAVFIMGYLAEREAQGEDRLVSAHEVADHSRLHRSVVANLLKQLARAGLLESVRGIRGGYRLARPAADISLREILEVVSGPFVLVDCAHDLVTGLHAGGSLAADHDCSLIAFCPSRSAMRVVHERIARLLADIRLNELVNHEPACSVPDLSLSAAKQTVTP